MAKTLLFFAYVIVTLAVFFKNKREPGFVRDTVPFFVYTTLLLCLIQFGSSYSMRWDYSRWKAGDDFGLFPLRVGSFPADHSTIAKSSPLYWFFTVLTTSLYVTFPQAVLRAGAWLNVNRGWWKIAFYLGKTIGIGIGFFATVITFTSLFSPFPGASLLVMLLAFGFLAYHIRATIKEDVLNGVKLHVPGGKRIAGLFGDGDG